VLNRTLSTRDGQPVELLGVDLFAFGGQAGTVGRARDGNGFAAFSFPPHQLWSSPRRMGQLGWAPGDTPVLTMGKQLPPVRAMEGASLGHRLLIDIGALQELSDTPGQLSWIAVSPAEPHRLRALRDALPRGLRLVQQSQQADPAELTRSFHLNLAAMGLLAFVVGIFLIYNALAFSYTDRRSLVRRMRLAGVDRRDLRRALLIELALFLLAGGLLGAWLGALLAAALLPGVGRSLAQLYDVYITYPDTLFSGAGWLPLTMTAVVAVLCALVPQRELLHAPLLAREDHRWHSEVLERRDRRLLLIGLVLLALSVLLSRMQSAPPLALAGMASLLLGAALATPFLLRLLLNLVDTMLPPRHARLGWMVADSRWLLGPAALALMAMTMALTANSGLNSMISSFRSATDQWLEQRLAADLFLPAVASATEVQSRAEVTFAGLRVVDRFRTRLPRPGPGGNTVMVEISSLHAGERYRDSIGLIDALPRAEQRFEAGEGIYVSERAWRLEGWRTGSRVRLCDARADIPVLGVYHDYGNPLPQWLLSRNLFLACWPTASPHSLAVFGPSSTPWAEVQALLQQAFDLPADAVINQRELKRLALEVFDRTFTVTRALNALTLLVAAIGIFCAISAIHHHRVGQQALLASLGVGRSERGVLLLLQWGLIGVLCLLLVWPFGTVLAAYLSQVVTPAAFGWSFPVRPELAHYSELALWALGSLLLAVVLPSIRLLNASPAALLKEQSL
jgi:putative ABC transport system permease protein